MLSGPRNKHIRNVMMQGNNSALKDAAFKARYSLYP